MFLAVFNFRGTVYGGEGGFQIAKQIVGGLFIIGWNFVFISLICVMIGLVIFFRMFEEELFIGDDVVYGEEVYVLWGDGEKYDFIKYGDDIVYGNVRFIGVI